jgi:hypothetical protein
LKEGEPCRWDEGTGETSIISDFLVSFRFLLAQSPAGLPAATLGFLQSSIADLGQFLVFSRPVRFRYIIGTPFPRVRMPL